MAFQNSIIILWYIAALVSLTPFHIQFFLFNNMRCDGNVHELFLIKTYTYIQDVKNYIYKDICHENKIYYSFIIYIIYSILIIIYISIIFIIVTIVHLIWLIIYVCQWIYYLINSIPAGPKFEENICVESNSKPIQNA